MNTLEHAPEVLNDMADKLNLPMRYQSILRSTASRIELLRSVVEHCWIHSNYPDCGYTQMTTEQKEMYNWAIGRENVVDNIAEES
jgi:hypothetical protein